MSSSLSTQNRLNRNMRLKLLAEGVSRAFSWVFFLLLVHILGASEYGRYSFPLAFTGLFLFFSDCGLNTLMIRELARYPQERLRYLKHLLPLKGLLSLFSLVLILLCAKLSAVSSENFEMIFWAGWITLSLAWLDTLSAIFNGLECIEQEVSLRLQNRLLNLASTLLCLAWSRSILLLLQVLAISNCCSLLWGYWQLQSVKKNQADSSQNPASKPVWNSRFAFKLLKKSVPFWLSGFFALLYFRVDVAMLTPLGRPIYEVGWYQAVAKLLDLLILVPNILLLAVFPVMSEWGNSPQAQTGPKQLKQLSQKGLEIAWLMALPLMVGGSLLSEPMLEKLLGHAFLPAASVWQILLWSLVFIYFNHVCLYALAALNLTRTLVWSSGMGVLLNAGLNYYWIPQYGFIGAGYSTVLTEILVCGVNLYALTTHLNLTLPLGFSFKSLLSVAGMGAGVWLFLWLGGAWYLALPLGVIVYASLLLISGTLTPEESNQFKNWLYAQVSKYRKVILRQGQ
jgi:O-antigen/teichoic acid export membrane protein